MAAELAAIQKVCKGYPLAVSILCRLLRDGRPYDRTVDAEVRRELFAHFQEAVYRRFRPEARRLLLAGTESDCTVTCTQEEGAVEFTSENY